MPAQVAISDKAFCLALLWLNLFDLPVAPWSHALPQNSTSNHTIDLHGLLWVALHVSSEEVVTVLWALGVTLSTCGFHGWDGFLQGLGGFQICPKSNNCKEQQLVL